MKRLTVGILAHVDSGKTTLSEGLLYAAGMLLRLGRVDHKNAFLDTEEMERERGITIFSKQARILTEDMEVDLLDTPGHADFSAETERALQVMDYGVLVVSGADGVQSHTRTLWQLLDRSGIPAFIFVNKMDLAHRSREDLLHELQTRLHPGMVDFTERDEGFWETVGSCDEALMDEVLENGACSCASLAQAVARRQIFPCLFGSALKMEGVQAFLQLLEECTLPHPDSGTFGARVYKITEDDQGRRLTHMKITGGTLRVRDLLSGVTDKGCPWQEKVSQIRLYSGRKFQPAEEAHAGMVCAVTGLSSTYAGQGLGTEQGDRQPLLEPVLRYALLPPEDQSIPTVLHALRKLEEEDPMLRVSYQEQLREIHVLLMGEIQLAVLRHQLEQRFGIRAELVPAGVAYKETIEDTVEGMGHYEPLRHYAEVRLLMEPGKRGSGLQFSSRCPEDMLDKNWQRLILTHLAERSHPGVLTGSPITDMRITLTAGRAHKKHTEGGDFRQATYRAVRQGLMQAKSVLLEPWYQFRLEVPPECIGRAVTDMQLCGGEFSPPETLGELSVLTGRAPAAFMMTYRSDVTAYTRGRGRLSCTPAGYAPCGDSEAVIAGIGYDPEGDTDNSPHSVFCSHGAGTLVKWNEVAGHMHTESCLKKETAPEEPVYRRPASAYTGSLEQDKELMEIFERTYGTVRREVRDKKQLLHTEKLYKAVPLPTGPEYVLVDGYNIIFAWDELKTIADESLDGARERLIHILSNYQGFRKCRVILVFDAYRVKGNPGSTEERDGISVVYTKEAETADTYIERTSHTLSRDNRVRVATSDGMEQIIILGGGALRVSAEEFRREILETDRQIRALMEGTHFSHKLKVPDPPK